MKVYIYELIDPITNETRYIGQTHHPKHRMDGHIYGRGKSHKDNWVKSLKRKDLKPIMNIIDEVDESQADFFETFYINLYKSWNCRLTNHSDGGKNGLRGKKISEEQKAKISAGNKGRKHTEETKAKMSAAQKGLVNKGRKVSEEAKAKISAANKGRKLSEETKAKREKTRKKNRRKLINLLWAEKKKRRKPSNSTS